MHREQYFVLGHTLDEDEVAGVGPGSRGGRRKAGEFRLRDRGFACRFPGDRDWLDQC